MASVDPSQPQSAVGPEPGAPARSGAQPELAAVCRRLLELHWRAPGYCSPNLDVYPWQWLWDSCFHAIVWAELGDERAVVELESALSGQYEASGFVPHMGYQLEPGHDAEFWGTDGWSSITQPPMYGHAVAELLLRGLPVPDQLVDRAARGLRFLIDRRRRSLDGLVELVHPWESGADDSIRWDDLMGGPDLTAAQRRDHKGAILAAVHRGPDGAPIANDEFPVGSVAMSALVAFNAAELGVVSNDDGLLLSAAELSDALSHRWDPSLCTWVDDGPTATGSGALRSVEALLPALVDPVAGHRDVALASLVDPAAHGAPYGPTGVHRGEPAFAPDVYWRGPAWPQLSYLLWVAARRHGNAGLADELARSLIRGAIASDFAEYWNPDTGAGLGACPQSWATLALVVAVR